MILVVVGHRYLNLEYLVQAEDSAKETSPGELPRGVLRVTLEIGITFDTAGDDAARLRAFLDGLVVQAPATKRPRRTGTSRVIRSPPPVVVGDTHSPSEPQQE